MQKEPHQTCLSHVILYLPSFRWHYAFASFCCVADNTDDDDELAVTLACCGEFPSRTQIAVVVRCLSIMPKSLSKRGNLDVTCMFANLTLAAHPNGINFGVAVALSS